MSTEPLVPPAEPGWETIPKELLGTGRNPDLPPCPACGGERWVCEDHPRVPWDGDTDCCGAPGMPCPECNATEPGQFPAWPPDSVEIWSTVDPARVRD